MGRDRIAHGERRNRKPGWNEAVDGRGLRQGEPEAGFTTCEGQPGKSGDRRHESRRFIGLLEATLASHSGTAAEWDVSTATGEASGDCQAGRRSAQVGHSHGAGSIYPASGDAGSAKQVGPNVLRT